MFDTETHYIVASRLAKNLIREISYFERIFILESVPKLILFWLSWNDSLVSPLNPNAARTQEFRENS